MSEPIPEVGRFQLRGGNTPLEDTGELVYCFSMEEAMDKFIKGGYWKLSWTDTQTGDRIRLVKEGNNIQITSMTAITKAIIDSLK